MDPSFGLLATHRAAIFAPPGIEGGKRGEAAPVIEDVACMPLDYVSAQAALRLGLEAPAKLRQTFMDGVQRVPRGAYLMLDGKPQKYAIRSTEPWDWDGTGRDQYTHLIVEALEA
jgi:hypothetical protein